MRVLVCAPRAAWPTRSGADLRCWQVINALARLSEVGLFALAGSQEPPADVPIAEWHVASEGTYPSAGDPNDRSWLTRERGLPSDGYYSPETAGALRGLLDSFKPDVVVVDQVWMHRYADVARSTGAKFVLNCNNVEAQLMRDLAARETFLPAKLMRRRMAEHTALVEGDLVRASDQVWVCSEMDRELLCAEYQLAADFESRVHVIPNAVDVDRYTSASARPQALEGVAGPALLFCGVLHYQPNVNAARYLLRDLFPKLRERYADARLLLVGMDPPADLVREAAAVPGVVVTGSVPDTVPYLQHSSMMLVPLFEGGGTRLKILEAFASQLPVISTRKGAEGLGVQDGRELLLAETTDEFLEAVRDTVDDPAATRQRAADASVFVERYSWRAAGAAVERAIKILHP